MNDDYLFKQIIDTIEDNKRLKY